MLNQIAPGIVLLCLTVTNVFAQEAGQIVGSVRDQSGALIPGAAVTITEAGTSLSRSMTTGSNGEFIFPNLRPTGYIVSAEAPRFRAFRQTGVTLPANQSLTVNIGMEVGAVTETVNVDGQTVQVDTSTSTLAEHWEPTGPWVDIRDRYEKFQVTDYLAGIHSQRFPLAPRGTTFYGDSGVPYGGVEGSWNNFAPRFGFAWDVFGDGKTSVRGGAGAFYDQHARGDMNNGGVDAAPWSPQVQFNNIGRLRAPYVTSGFVDPFPAAPPNTASTFPRPDVETIYVANGLDTPLIYNWNMTVERQLPPDLLVRAAHVGSRGIHQRRTWEFNPAVYSPGVTTATTDARRLFVPYYGTMTGYNDDGASRYNSLQTSLVKRYSRGFTVQINYTFSKSIDDIGSGLQGNGGGGDQVLPWTNLYYNQMIKGPSDFDHTHRIVTSYVWDIPVANHVKGFVKGIDRGWELTGLQQYQTGSPMTVVSGKDNSLTGLGRDRAVATGVSPNRPAGLDPLTQCSMAPHSLRIRPAHSGRYVRGSCAGRACSPGIWAHLRRSRSRGTG